MRRIFFLLLVFQSALCFSQTYNVDILNARKRIFLAGYAVDTVQNDTSFLYHVRSIPTSDAIARYMAGHGGGGGSKTIKQLLDENGSIGANNGFYYSGNGAIGSFGLNNVSPYMNYSRNGVVSTVRTGSDSFFLSTSYNGVLRSYIAGDTARVTLQGPVVNLLGINRGAPPTAKVMLRDTITGQVWYYDFLSPNGLAHTGTADWYVFARPDGTQRASQTLPDGLYSKFRNVGDGDSTMRQNPNDSLSFDLKSIKFDSPSGSIAFTKDTATDKNFYHVDAVESDPTVFLGGEDIGRAECGNENGDARHFKQTLQTTLSTDNR